MIPSFHDQNMHSVHTFMYRVGSLARDEPPEDLIGDYNRVARLLAESFKLPEGRSSISFYSSPEYFRKNALIDKRLGVGSIGHFLIRITQEVTVLSSEQKPKDLFCKILVDVKEDWDEAFVVPMMDFEFTPAYQTYYLLRHVHWIR